MARKSNAQINIRSDFVRERAFALAAETGKTVTQVLEDAVRTYRPPPLVELEPLPEGFEYGPAGFIIQTAELNLTPERHLNAVEEARESRDLQMRKQLP